MVYLQTELFDLFFDWIILWIFFKITVASFNTRYTLFFILDILGILHLIKMLQFLRSKLFSLELIFIFGGLHESSRGWLIFIHLDIFENPPFGKFWVNFDPFIGLS